MLNVEDSILVIIDVQEKLVGASKYGNEVASNITKLAKAADILNIPIVVTEQYPKGLGATVDNLKISLSQNTFITEKASFSAMQEANFVQQIKSLNRKQIVIGGIETHICVLQTAAELIKDGYEVYVIKDACASREKEEYKAGLDLLKQYGAKISCVEITLFEWLKTSKHPHFKSVQALIK